MNCGKQKRNSGYRQSKVYFSAFCSLLLSLLLVVGHKENLGFMLTKRMGAYNFYSKVIDAQSIGSE